LIMPNLPKLVSIWFPPEETGLATGIYNTGLMGGISTGLVIAPLLPDWSQGNLMLGGLVVVLGILFFLIVRDSPPGKEIMRTPLLEGIQTAAKSKNSWLAAMAVFFGLSGMVSIQSSLPAALNTVYGIEMGAGGQVASLITYAGVFGSLTLPALAEKSGKLKKNLILLILGFPIFMYLTWLIGGQSMIILWGGTILAGYIAGGSLPIFMSVPVYLPDIKSDPVQAQHVGGASGMLSSLMNMGGFIGFPFVVTPIIINFGYNTGLLVACILFATQAILAKFIDFK
ncbi:MAG: MFS transporter, partial [Bacillota bacterium]